MSNALEVIDPVIPYLSENDSVLDATSIMDEFKINELPIVFDNNFMGMITEDHALNPLSAKESVVDLTLSHKGAYVMEGEHYYEVLKALGREETDIIAILNEEKKYVGVASLRNVLELLSTSYEVDGDGAILILEINSRDYALSQLAGIAESNDIKIMSTNLNPSATDPSIFHVTLKFNSKEIDSLIASYQRFNYKILAKYVGVEQGNSDKERLDLLMRFINM